MIGEGGKRRENPLNPEDSLVAVKKKNTKKGVGETHRRFPPK